MKRFIGKWISFNKRVRSSEKLVYFRRAIIRFSDSAASHRQSDFISLIRKVLSLNYIVSVSVRYVKIPKCWFNRTTTSTWMALQTRWLNLWYRWRKVKINKINAFSLMWSHPCGWIVHWFFERNWKLRVRRWIFFLHTEYRESWSILQHLHLRCVSHRCWCEYMCCNIHRLLSCVLSVDFYFRIILSQFAYTVMCFRAHSFRHSRKCLNRYIKFVCHNHKNKWSAFKDNESGRIVCASMNCCSCFLAHNHEWLMLWSAQKSYSDPKIKTQRTHAKQRSGVKRFSSLSCFFASQIHKIERFKMPKVQFIGIWNDQTETV